MKCSNEALLEIGKYVSDAHRGQSQLWHYRSGDGWLFDVMLTKNDPESDIDRDMMELMQLHGTTDTALPKYYLGELSHGAFDGDQLDAIIGLIRVDPDAVALYHYHNQQLFISCGEMMFMMRAQSALARDRGTLQ